MSLALARTEGESCRVGNAHAKVLQHGGGANAGHLQQLRRANDAGADDDVLTCGDGLGGGALRGCKVDRGGSDQVVVPAVKVNLGHLLAGEHVQVGAVHDGVQVGGSAVGAGPVGGVDVGGADARAPGLSAVADVLTGVGELSLNLSVGRKKNNLRILSLVAEIGPGLHPDAFLVESVATLRVVQRTVGAVEGHVVNDASGVNHVLGRLVVVFHFL